MGNLGIYFLFLIPPLVIGFWIQHRLKTTIAKQMQVAVANGLTGEQVARTILDHNGLTEVPVNPAPGGPLSDHYDPRHRTVNLSQGVYDGRAVASVAIAAHEVGHAIQHQKAYAPFRLRSAMFPAVAFASKAWIFLLLIGVLAQIAGLAELAIVLFAVVVLFQLVTLPVEFDASRRAKQQLHALGLVTSGEADGAGQVLSAAALTYVAAALAALGEACTQLGVPEASIVFVDTVIPPPVSGLRFGFKGAFTTDYPTFVWIFANWTSREELRGVVRHEAGHLAFARTHTAEESEGHSGPSEDAARAFEEGRPA